VRLPPDQSRCRAGALRVFTLPQKARPVLLNLGEPGGFNITPWADRVELIDGKFIGT
jgi:hypothetical protein